MNQAAGGEARAWSAPAWLPAWVASSRHGEEAAATGLVPEEAWAALGRALTEACEHLEARLVGASEAERVAAHRHLLVLLALGADEILRRGDPDQPCLRPGNVDAVLKWGMDCPDAAYLGAPLRADGTYRVTGHRGGARYVGFQVMAGIEAVVNIVAEEVTSDDGQIDFVLGQAGPHGLQAFTLPPGSTSLVVRQFFYDWEHEEPARLRLQRLDGRPSRGAGTASCLADLSGQLEALGRFIVASLEFWGNVEDQLMAASNRFQAPQARTDLGGAAENQTVWGSWRLGPAEALVVEFAPPACRYWSIALGNRWWESLDYARHQTSLNGHQAVVDPDGTCRVVVAGQDPGVANWLDTTGLSEGPMMCRFVGAATAPLPATTVVELEALSSVLPPATLTVGPAARADVLEARRRGVERRFAR